MKLELKHLAPYLPYELKVDYNGKVWSIEPVIMYNKVLLSNEDDADSSFICAIKPILRPISSITKEEAYELGVLLMGKSDMEDKEVGISGMDLIPYDAYEWLFNHHLVEFNLKKK